MVYISPQTREITAKIVYYGPGMCGKTTNLQKVHELMRPMMKSDLVSVATETDRTIYFDFMPVKLGKIANFDFVVRTFTVPGQAYYTDMRKMVLQGADGVVFVADSQKYMLDQNKESMLDLRRNLKLNGLDFDTIPMVLQYNKRDLPSVLSVEDLDAALNTRKLQVFQTSAVTGQGVVETLKAITLQVFRQVRDQGLSSVSGANPVSRTTSVSALAAVARTNSQQSSSSAQQVVQLQSNSDVAKSVQAIASQATIDHQAHESIPMSEFKNIALLQHRLLDRVSTLEKELQRLNQEHQDLKRIVGKKLMGI